MNNYSVIPLPAPYVLGIGQDVVTLFNEALHLAKETIENGDLIVVTSKVISMMQERIRVLDEVEVTLSAKKLARKANIRPELAQLILEESEEVLGFVQGAVLTKSSHGLLPNAGIDESNSPQGAVILLPKDANIVAERIRMLLQRRWSAEIGVLIIDSNILPLRRGTIAVAIGTAGFKSVVDKRGEEDIFGRKLRLTSIAVADSLATAANLVMGEGSEMTPFAIIRGFRLNEGHAMSQYMPPEQCLIYSPLVWQKEKNR